MIAYAVVYSQRTPLEVDSIWPSENDAETQADALNEANDSQSYRVVEVEIRADKEMIPDAH